MYPNQWVKGMYMSKDLRQMSTHVWMNVLMSTIFQVLILVSTWKIMEMNVSMNVLEESYSTNMHKVLCSMNLQAYLSIFDQNACILVESSSL